MCKFESSQSHESRTQSADSSKVYSKLKAFNCSLKAASPVWYIHI